MERRVHCLENCLESILMKLNIVIKRLRRKGKRERKGRERKEIGRERKEIGRKQLKGREEYVNMGEY